MLGYHNGAVDPLMTDAYMADLKASFNDMTTFLEGDAPRPSSLARLFSGLDDNCDSVNLGAPYDDSVDLAPAADDSVNLAPAADDGLGIVDAPAALVAALAELHGVMDGTALPDSDAAQPDPV